MSFFTPNVNYSGYQARQVNSVLLLLLNCNSRTISNTVLEIYTKNKFNSIQPFSVLSVSKDPDNTYSIHPSKYL